MLKYRGHIYRSAVDEKAALLKLAEFLAQDRVRDPLLLQVLYSFLQGEGDAPEYEEQHFAGILEIDYLGDIAQLVEAWTQEIHELEGYIQDSGECWRIVDIQTDPVALDPLGVYWSWAAHGSWVQAELETGEVRYHADINFAGVDWIATLRKNLVQAQSGEHEVEFQPRAELYVHSVMLADGTVLSIEDYRRC